MCFLVPLALLLYSLLVLIGVARDTLFAPVDLPFLSYVCVYLCERKEVYKAGMGCLNVDLK